MLLSDIRYCPLRNPDYSALLPPINIVARSLTVIYGLAAEPTLTVWAVIQRGSKLNCGIQIGVLPIQFFEKALLEVMRLLSRL